MMTGLKNWACVAWRRDRARGAEHNCGYFPNKKECVWELQKIETDFSQRCTVTGQEAIDTSCSNGNSNQNKEKKKKPTKNNHPQKITLRGVKHYTIAQKGSASPSLEVYKTQLDKVLSNLIEFLSQPFIEQEVETDDPPRPHFLCDFFLSPVTC